MVFFRNTHASCWESRKSIQYRDSVRPQVMWMPLKISDENPVTRFRSLLLFPQMFFVSFFCLHLIRNVEWDRLAVELHESLTVRVSRIWSRHHWRHRHYDHSANSSCSSYPACFQLYSGLSRQVQGGRMPAATSAGSTQSKHLHSATRNTQPDSPLLHL